MTSHDTLILLAELAAAIAGFSSLVVALEKSKIRTWHLTQRLNLRMLLQVSAVVIFFSIFPLILERLVAQPDSWRIALWVYGIFHVVDVLTFIIGRPPQLMPIHKVVQALGLLIALGSLIAAALGSLLVAEIYYLCTLIWHLTVAALGFALLIFADPEKETV